MRTLHTDVIIKNVKEMCIEANLHLSKDMQEAIKQAKASETGELGKQILGQLCENMEIAAKEEIPICQDTGMACIFIEVGQDVHIEGNLEEAIHEGVRQGYEQGYLRKSVVDDPVFDRINTKDNTPAIINYTITTGDKIKIFSYKNKA